MCVLRPVVLLDIAWRVIPSGEARPSCSVSSEAVAASLRGLGVLLSGLGLMLSGLGLLLSGLAAERSRWRRPASARV